MNKQTNLAFASKLSRSLLLRFLLFYLLYLAAGAAAYLAAYLYYHSRIWYGYEPFYRLVYLLQHFGIPLFTAYAACGALLFGFYYLRRACRYLSEMMAASETLLQDGEELAVLSKDLKDFELRINQLKLEVLKNRRAAQDAEQRKNDLVVYLAHDLKTPLTSVIGYLTLLCDETQISPPLRQKYLGIALDKAERLEDLINEFFEITRFSLTHLTLELRPINLTRLLEQTVYEFGPMLAEKHLDCRLDAPADYLFTCDPDKLQRVFDNLLRNAVNYSFLDSAICITLTPENEGLQITVQNTGASIPPEKLERIFDQFFRLDTARSSGQGGAGLGLAIAREIVELHGGRISAESHDNQVIFRVSLPQA